MRTLGFLLSLASATILLVIPTVTLIIGTEFIQNWTILLVAFLICGFILTGFIVRMMSVFDKRETIDTHSNPDTDKLARL